MAPLCSAGYELEVHRLLELVEIALPIRHPEVHVRRGIVRQLEPRHVGRVNTSGLVAIPCRLDPAAHSRKAEKG